MPQQYRRSARDQNDHAVPAVATAPAEPHQLSRTPAAFPAINKLLLLRALQVCLLRPRSLHPLRGSWTQALGPQSDNHEIAPREEQATRTLNRSMAS